MRTVFAAALVIAALPMQSLVAQTRPEVDAAAERLKADVVSWRRDFHQHPELSNREERTAAKVAAHLRKLGLKPQTGVAHHGVVAVIEGGKPGPKIALRADMDALPVTEKADLPFASKVTTEFNGQQTGVMHACGHDAHTAILMGVAEALVAMRSDLPGQVMLIFQPAEEGAPASEEGGASLMLKEGLFKDFKPDAVLGLHVFSTLPAGTIGYRKGPFMAASDFFSVEVTGRQTHGSRPWGGIDPIVASAAVIDNLQSVVSRRTDIASLPAVLTIGSIHGGIRNNIIPDDVKMLGTLRTFDDGQRKRIVADMRNVIESVAHAHGAKGELSIGEAAGNPVTYNDPALTTRVLPSLQAVAGADKVVEMPLITGAEDFSWYAKEVPALFFFVGSTAPGIDPLTAPSNHSPLFTMDESALDLGLRAMLQASLDYLEAGR
ncbi:carboxypeptidase Ss1. Metallo peptidase. MEROPS family M20D [Solilutibacter tolerans]|uniref:Carboxypeptidase Ss1. Metallo peptidase. MEROPS family M20D n=2 Tax=Solilutibacter tolerans TaxID=1604334 RepID=A0A1N6S6R9_9GAMM|nr:amidohydrolase [Lysobacter tolerans]SIQ36646.1 carboxypeptidase Ss1. Metallo peptidase. MEROPS family M20D [Lysobacter tolerans]